MICPCKILVDFNPWDGNLYHIICLISSSSILSVMVAKDTRRLETPINVNLELETLKVNSCLLSHSRIRESSSVHFSSNSPELGAVQYRTESSVNRDAWVCCKQSAGMSFMSARNRSGPRIDPCGTPIVTRR